MDKMLVETVADPAVMQRVDEALKVVDADARERAREYRATHLNALPLPDSPDGLR